MTIPPQDKIFEPDGQEAGNPESARALWRREDTRMRLEQELALAERWEREQKDLWFWEKLGRLPFLLLDKLTPRVIRNKLGQAIDELGGYVQSGGRYLLSQRAVLAALDQEARERGCGGEAPISTVAQAADLPLVVMDQAADRLAANGRKVAAVQGATTGIGGLFTLAIDIPALLGLSLKVLQETALCYGFDPNDPRERVFIVKCLQFGSSDIVGKRALLEELAVFDRGANDRQLVSQLQGWREVVATYRDNFGWKKLFQLVPVAGMLFGALLNKGTVGDTAEAGKMLYRKRRILLRLQEEREG
ncbi:EcsC family protein [Paenibacillus hodogayensis]